MSYKPTQRSPEAYATIYRALRLGLGFGVAAELIGVHRDTIYKWREDDQEFDASCKRAKSEGVEDVVQQLQTLISRGNLGAICFWLKTRTEEFRERSEYTPQDGDTREPDARYL